MRTLSGARIWTRDSLAFKIGFGPVGKRLRAQGRYIRDELDPSLFPTVKAVLPNGYVMDRLYDYPDDPLDARLEALLNGLRGGVWVRRPSPTAPVIFLTAHLNYVDDRAFEFAPWSRQHLVALRTAIPWAELERCQTHGDPTLENMMVDRNGLRFLIDPLPPSSRMPQLMAVDLGKVLQSLYGYEAIHADSISYDDSAFPCWNRPEVLLDRIDIPEVEKRAALYFCAVHYLRLLPYQPEALRPEFLDILRMVLRDARTL